MNTEQQMDALLTPYAEPNTVAMEMYEHFYYDDINNDNTFKGPSSKSIQSGTIGSLPVKYSRQYNMPCSNAEFGGFDFEEYSIVPVNLNDAFERTTAQTIEFNQQDLIANIGMCYPSLGLKAIAEHVNRIYTDSETMESFVPGQRIGDYEYIVSETNYCTILFGRKQHGDEYITIHFWLK
jgi:hypothetical protein